MRSLKMRAWLAVAALFLTTHSLAQDAKKPAAGGNGNGAPAAANGAPKAKGPTLPGFVWVPPGLVKPGTTFDDYNSRHRGNKNLQKVLIYEVWGAAPAFPMRGYFVGKYEVTNAQWKHYLDENFKVEHTVGKAETLRSLANQYIKFRGQGIESEWRAIYCLNWREIRAGWRKMQRAPKRKKVAIKDEEDDAEEKPEAGEEKKDPAEGETPAKPEKSGSDEDEWEDEDEDEWEDEPAKKTKDEGGAEKGAEDEGKKTEAEEDDGWGDEEGCGDDGWGDDDWGDEEGCGEEEEEADEEEPEAAEPKKEEGPVDSKEPEAKKEIKKKRGRPVWKREWRVEDPPAEAGNDISKLFLPEGLKLVFYRHRVPSHWYGWCKLAGLRVGREYCDARKPPEKAFILPREKPFARPVEEKDGKKKWRRRLRLRAWDFGSYPVRGIAVNEALPFAEWAGCQIPTEYEFERAGRGDNPWQYTFGAAWNHGQQKHIMAWSDNPRCQNGPLRVDDETVEGSDTAFGSRNMLGNVWELTRTFFDMHPHVRPRPPSNDELSNYALIAKGGSFGDPWQLQQLSVRTGIVGNAVLDLRGLNRADTLGLRLVKHTQPGQDLLLHSIFRLTYERGTGRWAGYLPHGFAIDRMAGVAETHLAEVKAPYVFATKKAHGIAFAPVYITTLTDDGPTGRKKLAKKWKQGKAEKNQYHILGAFRSDVPFIAGKQLLAKDAEKLRTNRAEFEKLEKEWRKLPKAKQQENPLPAKPPAIDKYEKATTGKNEQLCGVWRAATIEPGEWLVVYWNGFLGLANKALTMPPDAILILERKAVARKRMQPAAGASLTVYAEKNRFNLWFAVEEQAVAKRDRRVLPDQAESERWALCEAFPKEWLGGERAAKARPYSWIFNVDVETAEGALAKHKWDEPDRK